MREYNLLICEAKKNGLTHKWPGLPQSQQHTVRVRGLRVDFTHTPSTCQSLFVVRDIGHCDSLPFWKFQDWSTFRLQQYLFCGTKRAPHAMVVPGSLSMQAQWPTIQTIQNKDYTLPCPVPAHNLLNKRYFTWTRLWSESWYWLGRDVVFFCKYSVGPIMIITRNALR